MQINGNINRWDLQRFGFGYIDAIKKRLALVRSRQPVPASEQKEQSFHLMHHALRLRKAIEAIKPFMNEVRSVPIVSAARAESANDLGLDTMGSSASLASTQEVNATPTSISTFGPEVIGSTAQTTVGGVYDGSNGTGTLTFKVTRDGTHGVDDLQLKVYDADNNEIDKIDIKDKHAIDRKYTLSNGLALSLGEGVVYKNDTLTIDVSDEPMSSSPTEPEWAGTTTDLITLGGVYDGSNGTGPLSFLVSRGGTHGVDDLQLKVTDAGNNEIDKIDIKDSDALDKTYTLSNGITLQLGEGSLLKGTTFSVEVFASVGSAVDPDRPFNGVRNDDPNLEHGLSVADGFFQINGVEIAVQADDSINTVLDRISQSDAGVTATFDAATEKVLLTQKTVGSAQDIVLGNDTSGFLAAVKLENAAATPGKDPETEMPLAEVALFSSMQSGSMRVNRNTVAIDVETDSLNDVLDRIANSGADVFAALDAASGRVSLRSEDLNRQLVLDSGTTNFFPALGISDGTYNSEEDLLQTGGVDVVNTPGFMAEYFKTFQSDGSNSDSGESTAAAPDTKILGTLVRMVAGSLNAIFNDSIFALPPSALTAAVRQEIRDAVTTWFDSEGPRFKTDFGIRIDFGDKDKNIFNFSGDDQRLFEAAVSNPEGRTSVQQGLFGTGPEGLFTRLHAATTSAASRLEIDVGSTGLFLDTFV
jgi:hypothetical protein